MSRENRKKKLSELNSESNVELKYLADNNSTLDQLKSQEVTKSQTDENWKGRHFTYVVYPESAPADWIEQLQYTGLPFAVSPLHDKDVNPDGTIKKAHYHVIVSWSNTTTLSAARKLCEMLNCPMPQGVHSCRGAYLYLTHEHNPEKYQYKEKPKLYNGWIAPLDNSDMQRIKKEIWNFIFEYNCTEYVILLSVCEIKGWEYFDTASKNTLFFKSVCDGFRNNSIEILERRRDILDDPIEKEKIDNVLKKYYYSKSEREN